MTFALLRNMTPPIVPSHSISELELLTQASQLGTPAKPGDGGSLDIERERLVLDSNGENPFSNFSSGKSALSP